MTKSELRKQALRYRHSLDADWVRFYSDELCRTFFEQVDLTGIKSVHVFLPIPRHNEPDTWQVIHRLWRDYPQIKTVCPVMAPDSQLVHSVFDRHTRFEPNHWGIPEPVMADPVEPTALDMVLVPLLVFDTNGHRIGYGKGFYDRFLAGVRPECRLVGYTFARQPLEITGIEETDVPLHACVTPGRMYSF